MNESLALWAASVMLGTFFFLTMLRVPMVFSMLASVTAVFLYIKPQMLSFVPQMAMLTENDSLEAFVFMILSFKLLQRGTLLERMTTLVNVLVGRFSGGRSHTAILEMLSLGCFSGRAFSKIKGMGAEAISLMKQSGYASEFATAVTVMGACQSILFPVSPNMVILATGMGGLSVTAIFAAGMIPFVLMAAILLAMSFWLSRRYHYPKEIRQLSHGQAFSIAGDAGLVSVAPVILLFCPFFWGVSVDDSAALACGYLMLLSLFVYRDIKFSMLPSVFLSALKSIAVPVSLMAGSLPVIWMIHVFDMPNLLASYVLGFTTQPPVLLFGIVLLLLLLGAFVDIIPLLFIMPVLLAPLIKVCGLHPIHFGIVMIYSFSMGLCIPRIGGAFVAGCKVAGTSRKLAAKAALPFYVALLAGLMLIVCVPELSLWLPKALGLMR